MLHAPKNRWTAAPLHLLLSLTAVGATVAAVILWCFPGGLQRTSDIGHMFKLMLLVDVVLGPLLTLLVYKPGKKGMKFDLACIAVLQLAFLTYGALTLWKSRPLYLVGTQESFTVVFANEVDAKAIETGREKHWPRFHATGPWLVAIDVGSKKAKSALALAWINGADPVRDPTRYRPYAELATSIRQAAKPRQGDDATLALPLYSQRSDDDTAILLDKDSGLPLRVVY